MGSKLFQFVEYIYIVMAGMSVYMVITKWDTERDQAYLFIFFFVLAVFMFFFRRKFRKKIEQRNQDR